MLTFVISALLVVCAGLAILNYSKKESSDSGSSESFTKFQYLYLSVYLCMTFADWLQGAYVYVLYESYGYSIDMISKLFILGFFSSMLFGTVIGSLSDKLGRRNVCLAFVVLYIVSCLTKHSSNLWILLFGRLTGGIATSILYSSFESWMVHEHFNRYNFTGTWIGDTFYKQTFANGVVAILAGFFSNFLFDLFGKNPVVPFDAAIIFLVVGGAIILYHWQENYGDRSGDYSKNFAKGWEVMKTDEKVLCVAISQSFFEAAMYIFVLMWTPTLKGAVENSSELNIGFIFASFMISVMIGSLVFRAILVQQDEKDKKEESPTMDSEQSVFFWRSPEYILLVVFVLGLISFTIPIMFSNFGIVLAGFLLFEFCVGVFWPAISTLKSVYIPEDVRSTVMNYIRIPTNFLVILSLYFVEYIPQFPVCCALLAVSICSQMYLLQTIRNNTNVPTVVNP